MRNLLSLVALAAIAFIGIGWYRDWYKVNSTPEAHGHQAVNIDFNKEKILNDVQTGVKKGGEKVQEVLDKKRQEASSKPAEKITDELALPQSNE